MLLKGNLSLYFNKKSCIFFALFLTACVMPVCAVENISDDARLHAADNAIESIEAKELEKRVVIEEPVDDTFVIDFSKFKGKISAQQDVQQQSGQGQNIDLVADEMEFFEETNELEARGNVKITIKPDNTMLSADKMVYNQNTNTIKAYDNVTIFKDGAKLYGDYMLVDMNEENVLMNEPIGEFYTMKIRAQEGYAYANSIEAVNGDVELAKKVEMKLMTSNFGGYDQGILNEKTVDFELKKMRVEPYKIKTKEIIINSEREHDTITFKNADIYYKKFKLGTGGNIKIVTNKTQDFIETNLPEVGSLGDFGFYFGPGYVQNLPYGSTIKVAPIMVIDDGKVGVGALAKFRSKTNYTEAAYGTPTSDWIVRGYQKLGDDWRLEYARHGYMDEWFQGERRPGYLAQLVYEKTHDVPHLNATYQHRLTGGYVSEYDNEEFGTARFRWQAELSKEIYTIGDKEQDMYLELRGTTQASATVYGTGEVVGIIRGGPMLNSRVKNWGSRISYFIAGVHGKSPFAFDEYRYGRSSINIDENIRLHRYLTVGYYGTLSPMRDNIDEELLTENRFYAIFGPDDLKVAIGYDTVRQRTLFDVVFLLGVDNTKVKFDKLKIKDPNKLGQEHNRAEDKEYARIDEPI